MLTLATTDKEKTQKEEEEKARPPWPSLTAGRKEIVCLPAAGRTPARLLIGLQAEGSRLEGEEVPRFQSRTA